MSPTKVTRVREVMTDKYQMVDGLTTVCDAISLMKESGAVALLVDKRHADDEYGIVLLSDIARHVLAANRAPDRVNIYEIMSKPVIAVHPDMDIRYCARLFDKFGIAYAPVLEGGNLSGLVTYADLVLKGFYANICNR